MKFKDGKDTGACYWAFIKLMTKTYPSSDITEHEKEIDNFMYAFRGGMLS